MERLKTSITRLTTYFASLRELNHKRVQCVPTPAHGEGVTATSHTTHEVTDGVFLHEVVVVRTEAPEKKHKSAEMCLVNHTLHHIHVSQTSYMLPPPPQCIFLWFRSQTNVKDTEDNPRKLYPSASRLYN